jgi:hypothetical protein
MIALRSSFGRKILGGTMIRTILFTVVGVLIASAMGYAQGERLPWQVLGSGGAIASVSGQVLLSGTIGQPIIGIGVQGQSRISQGFWLPIVDPTSVDEDRVNERSLGVSNFPNPFTNGTTIRITAPIEGALTIRVFDLVGNLVRTLDAVVSMTGGQDVFFDGLDNMGQPLGSGAYMYEVSGRSAIDGQPIYRIQRMQIIR